MKLHIDASPKECREREECDLHPFDLDDLSEEEIFDENLKSSELLSYMTCGDTLGRSMDDITSLSTLPTVDDALSNHDARPMTLHDPFITDKEKQYSEIIDRKLQRFDLSETTQRATYDRH